MEQPFINHYPAVLLGGPPQSGKSVLLTSLSRALRSRGVEHYALRAAPDGEGNWANLAEPGLVRTIRLDTKGKWTTVWVERIVQDIMRRRLPLLVDMGGKPTLEQERLFAACTHAILLTPAPFAHDEWQQRMVRNHVPLIADLTSQRQGISQIFATTPFLQGIITGLERATFAEGVVFDQLVESLVTLFSSIGEEAKQASLRRPPAEIVVVLDQLAATLGIAEEGKAITWQPHHLPLVLEQLPPNKPLAIYGIAPNWLHIALALFAYPASYYSFDPRLGWVQAVQLPYGEPTSNASLQFRRAIQNDAVYLTGLLPFSYIDYLELPETVVPVLPAEQGVILGGKLPTWLYASMAITYRNALWVAGYQPHLGGAVVASNKSSLPIGSLLSIP